jgi:hypothetical protein
MALLNSRKPSIDGTAKINCPVKLTRVLLIVQRALEHGRRANFGLGSRVLVSLGLRFQRGDNSNDQIGTRLNGFRCKSTTEHPAKARCYCEILISVLY